MRQKCRIKWPQPSLFACVVAFAAVELLPSVECRRPTQLQWPSKLSHRAGAVAHSGRASAHAAEHSGESQVIVGEDRIDAASLVQDEVAENHIQNRSNLLRGNGRGRVQSQGLATDYSFGADGTNASNGGNASSALQMAVKAEWVEPDVAALNLGMRLHGAEDRHCLRDGAGDRVGCTVECHCGFGSRCYPRFVLFGGTKDPFSGKQWFDIGVCDVDMRLPLFVGLLLFVGFFLGFLVFWRRSYPLRPKDFHNMPWGDLVTAAMFEPQVFGDQSSVPSSGAGVFASSPGNEVRISARARVATPTFRGAPVASPEESACTLVSNADLSRVRETSTPTFWPRDMSTPTFRPYSSAAPVPWPEETIPERGESGVSLG